MAVTRIGALIRSVLTGLQDIIYDINEDGAKLIGNFSSALGSLMGALKTALELALAIPEKWEAPDADMWRSFTDWVIGVFDYFYIWVTNWHVAPGSATPVQYTDDKMKIVQNWAAALNDLMGGLKTALELALAIPEKWETPPMGEGSPYEAFRAFVLKVFADFAAYVQANFPTDSEAAKNLPVVQAFAESMGAVMGALGSALDLMTGLQGYIPLLNTRIENFIESVKYAYGLIQTFALANTEGTAATQKFAEAAQAVFSALSTALELFKNLGGTDLTTDSIS